MSHFHHHRQRRRKIFFWLGLAGAALVVLFAFPATISLVEDLEGHHTTQKEIPPHDWSSYFASTTLQAKAAYVVDLGTGQTLFEKNAIEPLALASLTKLMTAATALDSAPTTTIVDVTRRSMQEGWGDTGLYVDERWRLGDLLRFTLVVSSNSGAVAVAQNVGALLRTPASVASETHLETASSAVTTPPNAAVLVYGTSTAALAQDEALFVQKMNELASAIGLKSARFFDPSGLDLDTMTGGAYASAQDVATLLIYLATNYPDIIGATRFPTITITSLSNLSHTGKNTDILSLQDLNLIASKTGYTDLAGGNLAIITNIADHPVVIVVLGSTYEERFTDVAALAARAAAVIAQGG